MFLRGITFKILIVFVCLFLTVLVFNQRLPFRDSPNSNTSENQFILYSYADLDRDLCKQPIRNWTSKSTLDNSRANIICPPHKSFVTVVTMGRTANSLWAYASLLSVARQTGLQPYIPSCIKSKLKGLLEAISISDFEDIKHCPVNIDGFVESVEKWKINPKTIILPHYIFYPEKILPWIQDIVQEFTFSTYLRNAAQKTLKNLIAHLPVGNYTFVGVHVRRTDYQRFLKGKYKEPLVDKKFFIKAMEYFKKKYNNTLFILLSDDPKWCIQQFSDLKNVFIASDTQNKKNGAELDLAVLAACNHTIFDYGTYGEWGAILAGGETILYNMTQNRNTGLYKLMKNWQLMQ